VHLRALETTELPFEKQTQVKVPDVCQSVRGEWRLDTGIGLSMESAVSIFRLTIKLNPLFTVVTVHYGRTREVGTRKKKVRFRILALL
jgi:hypothetical protein